MNQVSKIFECPHCHEFFIVDQLKCGIFRHGFYVKKNKSGQIVEILNQIKPHLNKSQCQTIKKQSNVIGCCQPFRIRKPNKESDTESDKKYIIESCNYDV